MNLNLTDRRITTALAAVFLLGLACVLLLVLAVLILCAMLVNALVSTIGEAVTTVSTLYTSGGPLTHLVFLVGVLFGIPFGFKRLRMPVLRFCQHQFARFTAFAQQQHTPPAGGSVYEEEERDYEEGEVIDLGETSENTHQARTTTAPRTANQRTTTGKSRKQRKKQKRSRQATVSAKAVLALTHV